MITQKILGSYPKKVREIQNFSCAVVIIFRQKKNEGRCKNCFRKISHEKSHNLFLEIYCNIIFLRKEYLLRFL